MHEDDGLSKWETTRGTNEGNWVQTWPGKSWNTLVDKSWKPADFELVK
jgi:hypothetical protein